jgi:tetrapyrrole methylase family protein/MazG family protein
MKRGERREKEGKASALEGVPKELPALLRAQRLQDKAARVGFDWKHIEEAWEKVVEEFGELREAVQERPERVEAEFGDLLFALVNLSRFLEVNAEEALRKSIARFIARFRYIEEEMARRGRSLEKASLEEMDALWEEAKAYEQQSQETGVKSQT